MLKPASDRLNYAHLLSPPPDYKVDFALGTTYSLDLEALVGISMALFLSEEMSKTMVQNPIVVLESLRRSSEQFAVICEAGQIKVPQQLNTVFSLLENSVFEVILQKDYSFHPKVWLIRYQNDVINQALYRFIVLSRNLTFDRSWDVAVCLEGSIKNKQKNWQQIAKKNAPLTSFIEYLRRHVKNTKKRNRISRMIDDLKLVRFDPMDQHITDFSFCPLGIPGHEQPPSDLLQSYKDLLVISPFLGKNAETLKAFDRLSLSDPTKVLITRRAETAKLSAELLQSFQVFVIKDAVAEGEASLSGEELEEDGFQTQDIHAKFYARSKYSHHIFFIGSANCSKKAFHGNVEFLLQLQYRKWGFRLENLLNELFGTDERENPFEQIETVPVLEETIKKLQDQLEKGIKQLCRTQSKATVQEEGNRYRVNIVFKKIPEDLEFCISPLSGMQQKKLETVTIIHQLNLEQLGEFYRIIATKDDTSIQRVIKIPTAGIPADRDQAIFKTIIRDRETFMKYVAYLLSDSVLVTFLEQANAERLGNVTWSSSWLQAPAFYENMLKTVSRDPERLNEIDRVIRMIDDPDLIPEKFLELYHVFLQAAKKVKK